MTEFEIRILEYLRNISTSFTDKIFEAITMVGEQEILIVIMVFIYFLFNKKAGQRIAFSVFTSLLVNNGIKALVKRPRPFDLYPDRIIPARVETATGYSFPSGHAQGSAATYTSLGILINKKKVWIIISILILLIAGSRIFLGVHYPSDAITGVLIGITIAIIGNILHKRVEDNFKKQITLYSTVAVLFFPLLFVFWQYRNTEHFYRLYKDFYTGYAFFIGYMIAVALEYRYVDFDCKNPRKIRIIRSVVALIIVLALQMGLKNILPNDNVLYDMLRYFLLSFVGLGIYPILARNWLFGKTEVEVEVINLNK